MNQKFFMEDSLPKSFCKQELHELFVQYQSTMDPSIREKIILHNSRLIASSLKSYQTTSYEKEELFSVGMLALIRSVDTFDLSRNIEFSTYAVFCIRRSLNVFVRDNFKHTKVDSLNRVVRKDKDGKEMTLGHFLADETLNVEANYEDKEYCDFLRELISKLPSKKRQIIKLYYGFTPDYSSYRSNEIAQMMGISSSRVSYILREVLQKFKEEFGNLDPESSFKVLMK